MAYLPRVVISVELSRYHPDLQAQVYLSARRRSLAVSTQRSI